MYIKYVIVTIFAFASCNAEIEFIPNELASYVPISMPPEHERQIYMSIIKQHPNLVDERDPEFLEEVQQKCPFTYGWIVEFDAYIKKQIAFLTDEEVEIVKMLFIVSRKSRRLQLAGEFDEKADDEFVQVYREIAREFHALSDSSKLNLAIYLPAVGKYLKRYAEKTRRNSDQLQENLDPFDEFTKSISEEDRDSLRIYVPASIVKNEVTFMDGVKKHIPVLYFKIMAMNNKIDDLSKDLEDDARTLINKFYSTCFKFLRMTLYGFAPHVDLNTVLYRIALEYNALSENSKAAVAEKFPFVAEALMGSLSEND